MELNGNKVWMVFKFDHLNEPAIWGSTGEDHPLLLKLRLVFIVELIPVAMTLVYMVVFPMAILIGAQWTINRIVRKGESKAANLLDES